jgi:hypothetical protein
MEDVLTTLRDMLLNIQKTEDDAAQAEKEDNGANKDTGDGERPSICGQFVLCVVLLLQCLYPLRW